MSAAATSGAGTAAVAERFRRVAAGMTARVEAVPADRWDAPTPCDGWLARDVVRHLTEWVPAFFYATWDLDAAPIPSPDDDPVGSWAALRDELQAALDDPTVADRERDTPLGRTFADAIATGVVPDVLIHTWDLARATGLDERLDTEEVASMAATLGALPVEAMVESGHYAPPLELPAGADDQSRVLAAMGRRP